MAKTTIKTDPAKLAHEAAKLLAPAGLAVERACRAANCLHSELVIISPPVFTEPTEPLKDSFECIYYCFNPQCAINNGRGRPPCKLHIGASETCKDYEPFVGPETIDLY